MFAFEKYSLMFYFYSINQEKKLMSSIRKYQVPLQKYMAMMELQVSPLPLILFTLGIEVVYFSLFYFFLGNLL